MSDTDKHLRLHPFDLFCQRCYCWFSPDAEDMEAWHRGFCPVRCHTCRDIEKKEKAERCTTEV